jgi:hypothetical protein
MNYLKIISYIFVAFYLVFTICKFYFLWEGYAFPIACSSNKLQNFWGKLFYLPIIISSVILIVSFLDKRYIVLKISILIVVILVNSVLYVVKDLTSQWYDIEILEDGKRIQVLHSSEIIKGKIEPLNYRVVEKTPFLKIFCWIELSQMSLPIQNGNFANLWVSYPIEINLND